MQPQALVLLQMSSISQVYFTYMLNNLFNQFFFSDEASFTWEGIRNVHNLHLWSGNNPYVIRESIGGRFDSLYIFERVLLFIIIIIYEA